MQWAGELSLQIKFIVEKTAKQYKMTSLSGCWNLSCASPVRPSDKKKEETSFSHGGQFVQPRNLTFPLTAFAA